MKIKSKVIGTREVEALGRMLGHLEHELPSNDVLVLRCKELIKEYGGVVKDE